ncbi:MAG: hypothetical protein ACR2L3_00515, partial [Actinomycetota bacterium]
VGGAQEIDDAALEGVAEVKRLDAKGVYDSVEVVVKEAIKRGMPTNIVYVANAKSPLDAALLAASAARRGGLMVLAPDTKGSAVRRLVGQLGLARDVDRIIVAAR